MTTIAAEEEPHGISDYDFMDFSEGGMMIEEPASIAPSIAPLIGTWEKDMALAIRKKMEQNPGRTPFMVGLVGMPGKSGNAINSNNNRHPGLFNLIVSIVC